VPVTVGHNPPVLAFFFFFFSFTPNPFPKKPKNLKPNTFFFVFVETTPEKASPPKNKKNKKIKNLSV
jgi:hypothetical protein